MSWYFSRWPLSRSRLAWTLVVPTPWRSRYLLITARVAGLTSGSWYQLDQLVQEDGVELLLLDGVSHGSFQERVTEIVNRLSDVFDVSLHDGDAVMVRFDLLGLGLQVVDVGLDGGDSC
jgi:hypothetical protein